MTYDRLDPARIAATERQNLALRDTLGLAPTAPVRTAPPSEDEDDAGED